MMVLVKAVSYDSPHSVGTILCIEDNPDNIRLLEHFMWLRPDVRMLFAVQGRSGFDLAREHRPDVIFLDLHLPDIPGEDVLRLQCGDDATHDLPVVIFSADATPKRIERLIAAGAERLLTMPFHVKGFLHIGDETLMAQRHQ